MPRNICLEIEGKEKSEKGSRVGKLKHLGQLNLVLEGEGFLESVV